MEIRGQLLQTLQDFYAQRIQQLIFYKSSVYMIPFIPEEIREYLPSRPFRIRLRVRSHPKGIFSTGYLSREALAVIVASIRHPLADERSITIQGFGEFTGMPDSSVCFEAGAHLRDAVINRRLVASPGLEQVDWESTLGESQNVDNESIKRVIAAVYTGNFPTADDSRIVLQPEDCQKIPQLVFSAFLDSIINALALEKSVAIGGLGAFRRSGDGTIEFDAGEAMRDAVKLFYLRQKPLPDYPKPIIINLDP